MNGTTNWVKWAMRCTPPKMIMPSPTTSPAAVTVGAIPQASVMLIAMLLACTPGNRKPVAITVASAKIHAYQRCPMAFSM